MTKFFPLPGLPWPLACVAALAGVLCQPGPARAHDAPATLAMPQGWQYPYNCCGNMDCRPLAQTAVKEKPGGYEIQSNGEVLGYTDPRLRDSPDGEWHRCSTGGSEAGKTICLFVPPKAY